MTMNIARYAAAAGLATALSLAAAQACFAGSTSEGTATVSQPDSSYYGYSEYVPGMTALVPAPNYATRYWAPDPALQWRAPQ
jgi:hypothetical protein